MVGEVIVNEEGTFKVCLMDDPACLPDPDASGLYWFWMLRSQQSEIYWNSLVDFRFCPIDLIRVASTINFNGLW